MDPVESAVALPAARRPLLRVALVALAVASALSLTAFFALAWAEGEVAARVVEAGARRGLTVEVGDVSIPLFGGIALEDVRLAAGGTPLAELPRVATDLGLFAALGGARRPRRVLIEGGSASIALTPDGPLGWAGLARAPGAADGDDGSDGGPTEPVGVDVAGLTLWVEGGYTSEPLEAALTRLGLGSAPSSGVALPAAVSAVITGTLERDAERRLSGSFSATVRQGEAAASVDVRAGLAGVELEVAPGGAGLSLTVAGEAAEVRLGGLSLVRGDDAAIPFEVRLRGAGLQLGERRAAVSEASVIVSAGPAPRVELAVAGVEASLGRIGPAVAVEARVGSATVSLVDPLAKARAGDLLGAVAAVAVEGPELSIRLPEGVAPAEAADLAPALEEAEPAERPAELEEPAPRPGDEAAPGRARAAPPSEVALDTAGTFAPLDALFDRAADAGGRLETLLAERQALGRRLAALGPRIAGGRLRVTDAAGAELLALSGGALHLAVEASGGLRGGVSADVSRGGVEAAHVGLEVVVTPDARLEEARFRLKGTEIAGRVAALVPQLRVEPETAVDVDVRWTPPRQAGSPHHVTGSISFSDLTFNHWRISDRDIEDLRGTVDFDATMDPVARHLVLDLPKIGVGEATLEGHVEVRKRRGEKPAFRFRLAMPNQDCGAAARAIPRSLLPNLSTLELRGEATFDARLDVDLARPRELKLNVEGDLERCEVLSLGPGIDPLDLKRDDYIHRPREPGRGELTHIEVGPGTPSWIPSGHIPRHAKLAAEVTEDRAWREHKGIQWGLVAAALKLDLEHGRFVYGGSTITQQLVKNIYLTRRKNLGRKFEEAIIAWQMERVLTKDEIMTLYVNCIEYGPDLYGIKAAAKHYFGKLPHELDPLESAFIMGLKPYPKAGYRQWTLGSLDPWWVKRVSHVLRLMARYGGPELTPEVAESYAPFQPNFRRSGQDRPTPRPGYPGAPDPSAPAARGGETEANEAGGPVPPPEAAP